MLFYWCNIHQLLSFEHAHGDAKNARGLPVLKSLSDKNVPTRYDSGSNKVPDIAHSITKFDFGRIAIQPKLKISHPSDAYEQEADRVAEQVMRTSVSFGSPIQAATSKEEQIDRKCAACEMQEEEEELNVSRKPSTMSHLEANDQLTNEINTIRSGSSSPLDSSAKEFMESRFGYDFGDVRIHTGERASMSAGSIHAMAYTVGNDIVFGEGQYQPNTLQGRMLLAHELTHVVQQNNSKYKTRQHGESNTVPDPYSRATKAEQIGRYSKSATIRHFTSSLVARQQDQDRGCIPPAGIPNTQCSAYLRNAWWLPDAYVNNATCACMTTPNSPKYNAIRKFLQDRLEATPTSLKIMAASAKTGSLLLGSRPSYDLFVQTMLTPRIYRDHVDAYANSCCSCGPASYPAWIGVTTVPLPCDAIGWSIRRFGSCNCTPGSW